MNVKCAGSLGRTKTEMTQTERPGPDRARLQGQESASDTDSHEFAKAHGVARVVHIRDVDDLILHV